MGGGGGRGLLPRGTFFRLQVYERVVISLGEVYERGGKSVFSVDKIAPTCLTGTFYGCILFMAGLLIYSYTVEPPLSGQ